METVDGNYREKGFHLALPCLDGTNKMRILLKEFFCVGEMLPNMIT